MVRITNSSLPRSSKSGERERTCGPNGSFIDGWRLEMCTLCRDVHCSLFEITHRQSLVSLSTGIAGSWTPTSEHKTSQQYGCLWFTDSHLEAQTMVCATTVCGSHHTTNVMIHNCYCLLIKCVGNSLHNMIYRIKVRLGFPRATWTGLCSEDDTQNCLSVTESLPRIFFYF